ncbi:MAG: hypothetical protein QXT84_02770 [Candidatus Bathyarchaeia archaeon]
MVRRNSNPLFVKEECGLNQHIGVDAHILGIETWFISLNNVFDADALDKLLYKIKK